jgi:hypothetical protein
MTRLRLFLIAGAIPLLWTVDARAGFTEELQFGAGHTIPVAWGDADGDGDLDLAVGNFGEQNQLFVNAGDGTFLEAPLFGAGATFAVVWADYDNDGDLDMAVGNGSNQQNKLFIKDGAAYTEEPQFGLLRTNAMAWGDYDNDGDVDLAVGNGLLNVPQQNYLYINNGDGTFTEDALFGAGQSASIGWADYDGDGDLDLAVGNGGFGAEGQNDLYINNGDGTFTEEAQFGAGDTACLVWGDADGDGDLDLAAGNWNDGQNVLYVNNGDGTFAADPQFGLRDTNTLAWGDADDDGDLDMAVGNGDFSSAESNYLYVNEGDGTFTEEAQFGEGSTDALAWGDAGGDGDLDVAAGNEHTPAQNYLYVNDDDGGGHLAVHLIGRFHVLGQGYSNRDGIGSKVSVYESGFLGDPDHLLGYREVSAHGGFASQGPLDPHFGIPGFETADVRVVWPGSGGGNIVQDLEGVSIPGRIVVLEGAESSGVPETGGLLRDGRSLRVVPNPTGGRIELAGEPSAGFTLGIFDALGRRVRTLGSGEGSPGDPYTVAWDGRRDDGRAASSGVYWVLGRSRDAALSERLLLVR